jgi:hypothetical protein
MRRKCKVKSKNNGYAHHEGYEGLEESKGLKIKARLTTKSTKGSKG